jgi:crossover junction endodeoxyribonuclease RusA
MTRLKTGRGILARGARIAIQAFLALPGLTVAGSEKTGLKRITGVMDELTIYLPWPDNRLSPNARVHWATRASAARVAKQAAYALTKHATAKCDVTLSVPLQVSIIFCPPDRRKRDWDNLIASMKPSLDGIAIALGIDDSNFKLSIDFGEPCKNGEVAVKVSNAI